MSDIETLIEKFQVFVKRLEAENYEVRVRDTKLHTELSNEYRKLVDNDDLPIRTLTLIQRLQTKASEYISRAYQE